MQEEQKTLKQYCREAKKRLKQGFWQSYRSQLDQELIKAEKAGISTSKVKEYYNQRVAGNIKRVDEETEAFYLKVKKILDEEGEISGVLGRLTDKEYYQTLSYEEQQRYNLTLSERYLKAVERYNKEKALGV
jgi:hypothetical protein